MLVGHFGVALGLKRFVPRMNLVWLAIAANFLDLLLWVLVLAGVERAIIPEQYEDLRYLIFEFPFSHSLVSIAIYTLMAGIFGYLFWRGKMRSRAGLVIGLAVVSHIILDLIVQPPQIPVAGTDSARIGMGLWNQIFLASVVEFLILLVGLILYYRATESTSKLGKYGPAVLFLLLAVVTLSGQMFGGRPPGEMAIAGSSLVMLCSAMALGGWFDTKRQPSVNTEM